MRNNKNDVIRSSPVGTANQSGVSRGKQNGVIPLSGEQRVGMALIDPRHLVRCSLCETLTRHAEEFHALQYSTAHDLINSPAEEQSSIGIIVLYIGEAAISEGVVQDNIEALHHAFPETPLILLSDSKDVDCSLASLCSKVSGYITTDSPPSVAAAALRLVSAGGIYIPADTLYDQHAGRVWESAPSGEGNPSLPGIGQLTSRQYEVFRLMREGDSNKMIAYKLGVQECTVKVHVRRIMRALGATNRTHAVFLAQKAFDGKM